MSVERVLVLAMHMQETRTNFTSCHHSFVLTLSTCAGGTCQQTDMHTRMLLLVAGRPSYEGGHRVALHDWSSTEAETGRESSDS